MKRSVLSLAACIVLWATGAFASGTDGILGTWTTEGGKSRVEIFECGRRLCGKILSLRDPVYSDPKDGPVGHPKTDRNNPDPSRRTDPIAGLTIMRGFAPDGPGVWDDGTIYDPENGKTYQCKATLDGRNRLKVRGYIGISLIGRTTVWTR